LKIKNLLVDYNNSQPTECFRKGAYSWNDRLALRRRRQIMSTKTVAFDVNALKLIARYIRTEGPKDVPENADWIGDVYILALLAGQTEKAAMIARAISAATTLGVEVNWHRLYQEWYPGLDWLVVPENVDLRQAEKWTLERCVEILEACVAGGMKPRVQAVDLQSGDKIWWRHQTALHIVSSQTEGEEVIVETKEGVYLRTTTFESGVHPNIVLEVRGSYQGMALTVENVNSIGYCLDKATPGSYFDLTYLLPLTVSAVEDDRPNLRIITAEGPSFQPGHSELQRR
jgi:hypothetical protein